MQRFDGPPVMGGRHWARGWGEHRAAEAAREPVLAKAPRAR